MHLAGQIKKYFIIASILITGFLGSLFLTFNSFAKTSNFEIQNAELVELSGAAEGSIWGFDNGIISSDITFHKLNDSVKYKITFKNTDTSDHVITSISDDNTSPYVTFSYDNHTNEQVKAGEILTFIVTAKYETAIANPNERLQLNNVKFALNLLNEEDPEEVIMVPNTSGNTKSDDNTSKTNADSTVVTSKSSDSITPVRSTTPTLKTLKSETGNTLVPAPNTGRNIAAVNNTAKDNIVMVIVFAVGLLVLILICTRNHKKSAKVITAFVAVSSLAAVATVVKAASNDASNFTISTRFTINDRFVITWIDAGGNEHQDVISYNEPANITDAQKGGYNFSGWVDENNAPYDVAAPVTKDVKIKPVFAPINYTIAIDTDGDNVADLTIPVNYEQTATLPENNNTKLGHQPNGWVDGNGNHYDDNADVSGLITEDGGTVSLKPDFTPNHFTASLDTDGDGNPDQDIDVTYGKESKLPANSASKPGHHPNGWTDNNGQHYNDGVDISKVISENGANISFTPDFAPNVFTIGLDTDGDGDDDQTLTVTYGQEALLPETPDPTSTGSKKNGWIDGEGNIYAEGEDVSDLLLGNGESLSLKSNYVPIEYTIAIDTDGDGDADINETVAYGESFTLPTNTSEKPGYNPNGWLNGRTHYDDGDSVQDLTTVDGSTVEIRPDYTPRTISICYTTVSDPTIVGENKCETATFDRMYYMSENYFTRTGYDPIDAWSYTADGEKAYETSEEYNPNEDILACGNNANCTKTLYAMWDPHQTTISYVPGDGVTDATGTVANSTFTYDQQATFTSNTFSRPGYTQSGWKLNGTDYNLGGTISKWIVDEPSQTAKATWTPEVYNISFNMNCRPNITGTGSMDNMTNITYDAGATLTSNSFSCGEGYSFAGWKRDNTGSLITNGGRADKFDVDANGDTVQLYAQWNIDDHFIAGMREAGKTKMTANDGKDYYKMQDMTSSLCSFVPTATTNDNNEEIQLVDTRDGKTYWVSKLKDGKCWMTQNLDLDLSTSKALTPNDSDVTASWTPNKNMYTPNQIGSWTINLNSADSYNPGDWYYQEGANVVGHNYTTNGANANFNTTPFASNGMHGHIGNMYNFQAFSAINDSSSMNTTGTTNTSICPKGWTLPSDYLGLLSAYGAISVNGSTVTTINEKALMAKPLYFVRSGVAIGSSNGDPGYVNYPGIILMYPTNKYHYVKVGWTESWQETVIQVYNPAQLSSDPSNTINQAYYGRGAGITVRCIAR